MVEGDDNDLAAETYQRETISNLYKSGIPTEIISLQLDISIEQVENVIEKITDQERILDKNKSAELDASSMDLFYLDAVVNIDLAIKHAQNSMWEALKFQLRFDISMEETLIRF